MQYKVFCASLCGLAPQGNLLSCTLGLDSSVDELVCFPVPLFPHLWHGVKKFCGCFIKYFVVSVHQGTNICVNKATLVPAFRGRW